jgi:hypothetical protein
MDCAFGVGCMDRSMWTLSKKSAVPTGPVVIKKFDKPLFNLAGAMRRCSREKVLMCTEKKKPLFQYRGFSVYSFNKTGDIGGKCF